MESLAYHDAEDRVERCYVDSNFEFPNLPVQHTYDRCAPEYFLIRRRRNPLEHDVRLHLRRTIPPLTFLRVTDTFLDGNGESFLCVVREAFCYKLFRRGPSGINGTVVAIASEHLVRHRNNICRLELPALQVIAQRSFALHTFCQIVGPSSGVLRYRSRRGPAFRAVSL